MPHLTKAQLLCCPLKWCKNMSFICSRDGWQRRCTEIVAIDALQFRNFLEQFRPERINRELNKVALLAFFECFHFFLLSVCVVSSLCISLNMSAGLCLLFLHLALVWICHQFRRNHLRTKTMSAHCKAGFRNCLVSAAVREILKNVL